MKPLSGLVKPGAKYLNFNYTEFAETLYGAKGVCYIHGSRKNRKAKLILGHSYKKYVPDVSVKMPRFKDGFKRGMVNIEKVVSEEKIRQLSRSIMDVLWFSLWNKAE